MLWERTLLSSRLFLCGPNLRRAAQAKITNVAVGEFCCRETYYAWSSRKASKSFFFCIAFTLNVSILSKVSDVFVQLRGIPMVSSSSQTIFASRTHFSRSDEFDGETLCVPSLPENRMLLPL